MNTMNREDETKGKNISDRMNKTNMTNRQTGIERANGTIWTN